VRQPNQTSVPCRADDDELTATCPGGDPDGQSDARFEQRATTVDPVVSADTSGASAMNTPVITYTCQSV